MRYYWIIRDNATKEAIGVFEDVEPFIDSTIIVSGLNRVIGDGKWDWYDITKAEFETYQAFGFKEYKI